MKRCYWFVLFFFLLAYILPLDLRPMIAPDEFRYAEIPREMIERGDYVVPYLVGTRYFEKPALGYQWTAAMFHVFGVDRLGLRLPPALAAGGAAFLLIWLVRRMTRDDELAALSGGLFLMTGMVYGLGIFAVLDSQLNFFLTGTLVCYYLAIQEAKMNRRKFLLLAATGVFAGCAFMAKGFLAFAVPGVTVLPYLIWQKRWRDIWTTPWIPLFFVALTALPWSLAIHFREPNYWHYFFWEEHVKRMLQSDDGQHPEPIWFFIPVIIGGLMPVLLLLPAAIKGYLGRRGEVWKQDFVRFLLCWFVFPFLFFSASSGKLATYVLPCYAPLAVLLAMGVQRYMHAGFTPLFDKVLKIVAIVLAVGVVGFSAWQMAAPQAWTLYQRHETLKWVLAAIAILTFCIVLALASRDSRRSWKLPMIAAGFVPLLIAGNYAVPGRVLESKAHSEALAVLRENAMPGKSIIAVNSSMMHSVAYNYHLTDLVLLYSGGELAYGLSYPEAEGRNLSMPEFKALIESKDRPPVVMITRRNQDEDLAPGTPEPDVKQDYHEIFLRRWN